LRDLITRTTSAADNGYGKPGDNVAHARQVHACLPIMARRTQGEGRVPWAEATSDRIGKIGKIVKV